MDPAFDRALRELHALKGETAMGGLRAVSQLAHGLETLVLRRRGEEPLYLEDVREALRVLGETLSASTAEELVASPDVEALLAEIDAAARLDSFEEAAAVREGGRDDVELERRAPAPPDRAEPVATAAMPAAPVEPQSAWLRVEARQVEELSGQMSELTAQLDTARAALGSLRTALDGGARAAFQTFVDQLDTVRSGLVQVEERAWDLRLVPLTATLERLADHVEGIGRQLGKKVRVVVDAHGVALERSVVEALHEPLLHLVRNAVDHGLEQTHERGEKSATGTIRLVAGSEGSEVVVSVSDDGRGLDPEAIRRRAVALGLVPADRVRTLSHEEVLDLIFANGFSEREVANELSGRGVGLSAVRGKVEELGGAVLVSTTTGEGTRFDLVLPAAVARERVLVVESAGLAWAIPSRWVRSVVRDRSLLERALTTRSLRLPDGLVPVRALSAWLGARRGPETAAVVLEIAGRRTALLVARTDREVELLRAPTDALASAATRVAASGVLPDGRVALFLRWAEVLRESARLVDQGPVAAPRKSDRARVLVADDSPVIRDIVAQVLGNLGVEVTTAEDGKAALDLVTSQPFDLVVTDVEMPRLNGLELLRGIRQRTETLPVIMLTTRSKPEQRREAALMGANAYIAKSEFRGDTLADVVRRFVDLGGAR